MTLTPSHRAHPFHRREGGLMGFDHDHGRGLGGDPEPFIQGAVQINDLMPNACWKPQCERLQGIRWVVVEIFDVSENKNM